MVIVFVDSIEQRIVLIVLPDCLAEIEVAVFFVDQRRLVYLEGLVAHLEGVFVGLSCQELNFFTRCIRINICCLICTR